MLDKSTPFPFLYLEVQKATQTRILVGLSKELSTEIAHAGLSVFLFGWIFGFVGFFFACFCLFSLDADLCIQKGVSMELVWDLCCICSLNTLLKTAKPRMLQPN